MPDFILSDSPCNLCPRECMVNRCEGHLGYCRCDGDIYIARAALHFWEEPCISGKNGSGTVFFSGCNLRCVYCQNYGISSKKIGYKVDIERLSEIFLELERKKAHNINLVTPDMYILGIIAAISRAREKGLSIPIVYNGSGYEKPEVIALLKDYIDIYLTDFKYMDSELAGRLSGASDYPEVAKSALRAMYENVGDPVFEDGLLKRGVIVRNLLLPNHKKNTKAVIDYIYTNYGDGVYISIMNQYTPFERVMSDERYKDIARKVKKREYEDVINYALEKGINNAYFQEGDTAKESFIPEFNGEGV